MNLQTAISELENKQKLQIRNLKDQVGETVENLNPLNLLKRVLQGVADSREIKGKLLTITIGLTAGYISKRLVEGEPDDQLRKTMASLIQVKVINFIIENPEIVNRIAAKIRKAAEDRN